MCDKMNKDRVTLLVADIEKYLMELEDLNVKTKAGLREKRSFYAVSMVLLTIFNRVIDLGQELVISKKLGMPATYAEIFALLARAGVIDKKLLLEMKTIVRIRNRLSHEYFTFTEEDVFEGLKSVSSVSRYVDAILKEIKKSS